MYDIEVSGISLITNYREEFTSEVKKTGIDGLIQVLKSKNVAADRK